MCWGSGMELWPVLLQNILTNFLRALYLKCPGYKLEVKKKKKIQGVQILKDT